MLSAYKSLDNYRYFLKKPFLPRARYQSWLWRETTPKEPESTLAPFFIWTWKPEFSGSGRDSLGSLLRMTRDTGVLECCTKPTLEFNLDKSLHYSTSLLLPLIPVLGKDRWQPLGDAHSLWSSGSGIFIRMLVWGSSSLIFRSPYTFPRTSNNRAAERTNEDIGVDQIRSRTRAGRIRR